MGVCRSIEFWRSVRSVVEAGLSLQRAAKQFGVSRAHVTQRARVEDWQFPGKGLIGRPRTMDLPDGEKRTQMAREEADRDIRQAELIVEARTAVFDVRRAEILAQKILAQHSTKMKVALSELVLQTAEDLRSGEVRPKDRAQAMVALKTVGNQLYGWDQEPDLRRMKRAGTSYADADYMPEDFPPTGAVNLRLIATTPEQLAALAKAKSDHSGDHFAGRDGGRVGDRDVPSATECNDQGMGPSAIAPEQPPAATYGCPIPQKEAPPVQDDPRSSPAFQEAEAAYRRWEQEQEEGKANLYKQRNGNGPNNR